jgi:hypothetical protein
VLLDGKVVGKTPLSLDASSGAHQLTLRHERYATHESTVRAPGEADVVLRRPVATLSVRSTPSGATVQLGSVSRGVTPADLKLPAFENYYVRVVFPDGRFARKQLYLKPPGDTVKATLPPKGGR